MKPFSHALYVSSDFVDSLTISLVRVNKIAFANKINAKKLEWWKRYLETHENELIKIVVLVHDT